MIDVTVTKQVKQFAACDWMRSYKATGEWTFQLQCHPLSIKLSHWVWSFENEDDAIIFKLKFGIG